MVPHGCKVNPEYLKATHVVLWIYPGAPSFYDQLLRDQEVQDELEATLNPTAPTDVNKGVDAK